MPWPQADECNMITNKQTPKQISEETMKTHIFTPLSDKFEMTIKILERQIPPPTAQEAMVALKEDAE
jgi:hypothetical protein